MILVLMLAATSSPLIVLRGICTMSLLARQQCDSNQAVRTTSDGR
ncbi:hypothetical protein [Kosakonia sp. MUSA4]|nr:hypothetical protein [Kosakonia sp. MUSA4]